MRTFTTRGILVQETPEGTFALGHLIIKGGHTLDDKEWKKHSRSRLEKLERRIASKARREAVQTAKEQTAAALMASLTEEERQILQRAEEIKAMLRARELAATQGPLADLPLTVRTVNILAKEGLTDVAALAKMSDLELLKIPNLGKKAVQEIRDCLAGLGAAATGGGEEA